MNTQAYLDRLCTETAHIAAFAADRDPRAATPTCPGLTVGEVVRHLGSAHRRTTGWIRTRRAPETWQREPGPGEDLIAWFTAGAGDLCSELAAHRPEDPCDTWWPEDRTVGFWWRRMAHETTVHRVDIETAYGPAGPVDSELAADGVDEVLTLFLEYRLNTGGPDENPLDGPRGGGAGEIVGVAAGPHLWRVVLGTERVEISRELPHDNDAVVLGDPGGVYLWLWGRRRDDAVRISGDATAGAALRTALARATR